MVYLIKVAHLSHLKFYQRWYLSVWSQFWVNKLELPVCKGFGLMFTGSFVRLVAKNGWLILESLKKCTKKVFPVVTNNGKQRWLLIFRYFTTYIFETLPAVKDKFLELLSHDCYSQKSHWWLHGCIAERRIFVFLHNCGSANGLFLVNFYTGHVD